jgi:PS-10 peptidase S37
VPLTSRPRSPLAPPARLAAALFASALALPSALSCSDWGGDLSPGGEGPGGAGGAGDCPAGVAQAVLGALRAVPGLSAEAAATNASSACAFDLTLEQPVDHDAPAGGRFLQRARLLHRSPDAPLSLASTGYALFGQQARDTELSYLLGANLLVVEHRYFLPSAPEPRDWTRLTIAQAAADHHRFVEALRPLYPGPWLSEGASKGGMTSVYHRRFYPADVVGTVAYVAPQSEGPHDPRYGAFLEQVGDAACRERIVALQRAALAPPRRERLVAQMVADGAKEGRTFDFFGPDQLFEFAIGEARFLFWQYEDPARCDDLPAPDVTDDELYAFFDSVLSFADLYDDGALEFFAPYYYQAATQLGGNAPIELHLEDLLRYPGANVIEAYPPAGVPKAFDPAPVADVAAWLSAEGERIIFVYGEYDPWTAATFDPGSARDTYKFTVPRGNHGSHLLDLPDPDRAQAFAALEAWSGVTPRPPPPETASALAASWRRPRPPRRPALAP